MTTQSVDKPAPAPVDEATLDLEAAIDRLTLPLVLANGILEYLNFDTTLDEVEADAEQIASIIMDAYAPAKEAAEHQSCQETEAKLHERIGLLVNAAGEETLIAALGTIKKLVAREAAYKAVVEALRFVSGCRSERRPCKSCESKINAAKAALEKQNSV